MKKLLPHELSGNSKSNILVVLLHGFPDTIRLWDDLLKKVPEDVQYLTVSYPNFHKAENSFFGQSLNTVSERVKDLVEFVDAGRRQKKIFVTHDWGAVLGYMVDLKYPGYIDDMIALDAGGIMEKTDLKTTLAMVTYQWLFAFCFLLSFIPIIGTYIGTKLTILSCKYYFSYQPVANYCCTWNYWYVYHWANIIYGTIRRSKDIGPTKSGYKPSCPVVFIFGAKKAFQFHGPIWKLVLSENKDSEFISAATGHWIMKEDIDLVSSKIIERLKRLKGLGNKN